MDRNNIISLIKSTQPTPAMTPQLGGLGYWNDNVWVWYDVELDSEHGAVDLLSDSKLLELRRLLANRSIPRSPAQAEEAELRGQGKKS